MIERTKDYRRVKGLAPDWALMPSDKVYYLIDVIDGVDVGAICFHPCHKAGMMVHVVFQGFHRGKDAARSVTMAFDWMFKNTNNDRIVADIPVKFRPVHFLARNVGMIFDGVEENLFRCYYLTKCDHKRKRAA